MKLNQTKPFLCRNIGFFRKGNKSVTWGHLTNWADNRKNSLKTPFSPHIMLEYNQYCRPTALRLAFFMGY